MNVLPFVVLGVGLAFIGLLWAYRQREVSRLERRQREQREVILALARRMVELQILFADELTPAMKNAAAAFAVWVKAYERSNTSKEEYSE